MRHYETIYIMNPNLGEEEYREAVDKFNALIEENKGLIIKTQEWGKQRLAYLIQKFNYGSYVFIEFCADAGVTAGLERAFKLDDRVLKCQTVKLADKVYAEALIQKEKEAQEKNAPEEPAAEEETAVQKEEEDAPVEPAVEEEAAVKEEDAPEETAAEEETAVKEAAAEAGTEETVTESTDSEVENGVSEE